MNQKTIKKSVQFEGIGVHFGLESKVVLEPASPNSGIIFVNEQYPEEKIFLGKIIPEIAMHASVLKSSNWTISTVEHLMAAISAFRIDNLVINIKGPEIPILDGSALGFVHFIQDAGVEEQRVPKYLLTPRQELKFEDEEGRLIQITPPQKNSGFLDRNLYFDYLADFAHPLIGQSQLKDIMSPFFFAEKIAPARTFGFLEQLPFLRKHGLAKGTTLGNTVVIGEEEFLNDRRFEDEFVRHKLLDLIGDLALLGKNLAGKVKASKTGHSFNRLVVEHYVKNPELWELI